jgi:hypothetical protein
MTNVELSPFQFDIQTFVISTGWYFPSLTDEQGTLPVIAGG